MKLFGVIISIMLLLTHYQATAIFAHGFLTKDKDVYRDSLGIIWYKTPTGWEMRINKLYAVDNGGRLVLKW